MKITQEHYDALKEAIDKYIEANGKEHLIITYETGHFYKSDKVRLLQQRFCFDLLYCAGVPELIREIYKYANDDHIFTALKKICPTVTRKY